MVDAAGVLSPEQIAALEQQSAAIEQASSRQFVVATIPDLQGYAIEDYGYKLGRFWKIGQDGANNGIILIVAPNDRKVRIEVGYGLEPIMTDALSSMIIRDTIIPKFKSGDLPGGIVAGAAAIAQQMKLPTEAAEQRAVSLVKKARRSDPGGGLVVTFFILIVVFFILPRLFARAGGRRYRSSGGVPIILWGPGGGSSWGSGGSSWGSGGGSDWGGGGGGFSGGGGSFGGGGSSGSW